MVLSGTATDGTLGLEEIKADGRHHLRPGRHGPARWHAAERHRSQGASTSCFPRTKSRRRSSASADTRTRCRSRTVGTLGSDPNLAQVVQLLHRGSGVDFGSYKFNTFYRRITRRMVLQKIEETSEYVQFLRRTPAEVDALFQDILISVTSFFRDPEAFEALKKQGVSPPDPRAVPARSGTRLDARLLDRGGGLLAGDGVHGVRRVRWRLRSDQVLRAPTSMPWASRRPARASTRRTSRTTCPPERLRRFFTEVDGGYRIAKSIREACIFSRHNVLSDPPFSRIDLISCRNLLIYLEPELQQRVIPTLHYALKPSGFLWLGGSETIGSHRNLFEVEDAKHKIYTKKSGRRHGGRPLSAATRQCTTSSVHRCDGGAEGRGGGHAPGGGSNPLDQVRAAGVLVSADLDILQYRGDTSPYLAPAPGKASLHLLKMLREGLPIGVRAAILRAGKQGAPVREAGLRVKFDGGSARGRRRSDPAEVSEVPGGGYPHPVRGGRIDAPDAAAGPNRRTARSRNRT